MFWCAGMYASGSTWAYNAMRAIAACLQPDRPVRGRFVNTLDDMAGLADGSAVDVVKSHDLTDAVAAAMRPLAGRIVATIRDPRDAVTSLMLYQRHTFDLALERVAGTARFVGALADEFGTLLLRYEDGFPDDPVTLERIAACLGGNLAPADRDRLFAQSRRDAIETLIGGLETLPGVQRHAPSGDIYDPETQWHRHHAGRSGEVGRWRRMLRARQARAVEGELRDFMVRFGYLPPSLPLVFSLSGAP